MDNVTIDNYYPTTDPLMKGRGSQIDLVDLRNISDLLPYPPTRRSGWKKVEISYFLVKWQQVSTDNLIIESKNKSIIKTVMGFLSIGICPPCTS